MNVRLIKNDKEHKAALKRLDLLWDCAPGTPGAVEFEALTMLVDAYERERYPIPPPTPEEAIKFRMEQEGADAFWKRMEQNAAAARAAADWARVGIDLDPNQYETFSEPKSLWTSDHRTRKNPFEGLAEMKKYYVKYNEWYLVKYTTKWSDVTWSMTRPIQFFCSLKDASVAAKFLRKHGIRAHVVSVDPAKKISKRIENLRKGKGKTIPLDKAVKQVKKDIR